jgi:hypothetical protein
MSAIYSPIRIERDPYTPMADLDRLIAKTGGDVPQPQIAAMLKGIPFQRPFKPYRRRLVRRVKAMGREYVDKTQRLSQSVIFRISPEELEFLKAIARAESMTISAWVHRVVVEGLEALPAPLIPSAAEIMGKAASR